MVTWEKDTKSLTLPFFVFTKGYDNYFMLKIRYCGIFTKGPGRKYIDGIVAYVDDVDTDLFSVHGLDDMVRELRLIRVYIENGQTKLPSHYKSPSKAVIEELEPNSKPCRREVGSCSRKPDLNQFVNHVFKQSQVLDVDEGHDY
uniref:Uncharacterized protein n=1 Tax=Lactuca sativa TaxID=4236 RepID=A0A9R1VZD0_LACSA|nr:hypothetical protein LSAT_V11C400211140 [Lactuca sativa]